MEKNSLHDIHHFIDQLIKLVKEVDFYVDLSYN